MFLSRLLEVRTAIISYKVMPGQMKTPIAYKEFILRALASSRDRRSRSILLASEPQMEDSTNIIDLSPFVHWGAFFAVVVLLYLGK